MKYEDLIGAAAMLRKYATAVETTLYWNMTTREAKDEIKEIVRLAEALEEEAATENTDVKPRFF